jgi:quinoprotein glucose dehydrogenase
MPKDVLRQPVLLVAILAVAASAAGAQDSVANGGPRSTLTGVYTREQANRGRDVYAGMCQSCHTPASHTGVTFANSWVGRPLSDLFSFVSEKMPKNEPGSLTPEEYSQVVAHLLRLNGMPAGFEELPVDTAVLKQIRIEVRKSH